MKTSSKLKRIGLRTVDRGGSNLVLGLFHYHPEFFSLSEKITFDTKDYDSFPIYSLDKARAIRRRRQLSDSKYFLKWLLSENCSMFKGADKANKNMDKVRNIVIKIPRETFHYEKEGQFEYKYCNHEYDKICYLIRNPFRVVMSHLEHFHRLPSSTPHDILHAHLDKIFEDRSDLIKEISQSVIKWTAESLQEYKKDIELGFDSKIIFLEYLLKNFEEELPKLINWADQDTKTLVDRSVGATFAGTKKTWTGRGHGGFDPYAEISYERATSKNIHSLTYTASDIDYVIEKLGPIMFDYWYNDKEHDYVHKLNLDLI